MLEEMHIRALGVIDDAVLQLAPGLTVITGETGAGKTMVITGLGLLFGGRADSAIVRADSGAALVEGRLRVEADGPAAARAAEAGAEVDDGVLIVARSVTAEGRSRAHLGGRAVPAGVLAELAEHCLAVHGQADQFRLLSPGRQRDALDRYAGTDVARLVGEFGEQYAELHAVERELDEVRSQRQDRAQEADLLRFGLEEIAAVGPNPGEDATLSAEEERLAHADALRRAAGEGHALLAGDTDITGAEAAPDAGSILAAARATVDQAAVHDPTLDSIAVRLREVGFLLAEVAADLAAYETGIDSDPARLAVVQERRAALARLCRKYGGETGTVDEVLAWSERAVRRLIDLEDDDDRVATLFDRSTVLRRSMAAVAGRLTATRTTAAARLAAAVTGELAALAMPQARLEVSVRQSVRSPGPGALAVDDGTGERLLAFGAHGVDDVEISLCPHPGAPPRPVHKGASGGELSRVMLALEVVLAGADPVPTMVFDEVDAGVGGKAAVEVGRRLGRLAESAQVIVVTHLPQVAAFADRHLVVRKESNGTVTSSGVTELDAAGRVSELSRMFAGLEQSESARAHAIELLAAAGRPVAESALVP